MVGINKKKSAFVISILLILAISLFIFIDQGIKPTVIAMCEAKVRYISTEAMNNSVKNVLGKDINYTDLVNVLTDKDGKITMIQANTVKMNSLASEASSYAQDQIGMLGKDGLYIPLGSVFRSKILAGLGPNIKIKMIPMGSVSNDFDTEFENAGINQTRHKIFLIMRAQVMVVVPLESKIINVSTKVPITETIIVGNVPDYFVNIDDKNKILNLIPDGD